MSSLQRVFGALAGLWVLSLAAPAGALTIDPSQSSIVPQVGVAESLSGTIDVSIGSVPLTQNTTFDVVGLSAAAGGATFTLDPASPGPGLGVIGVSGAFLIPTLFLAVDPGGGAFPLAVPNVTGTALFDASGTLLRELSTTFQIDSGGPEGILTVTVVAVPEPSGLLLAAAGLVALGLRRRAAHQEIIR